MQKIAEIANNLFTFSDVAPPIGDLNYQVVVVNPYSCNISNLKSTDYSNIRSNIVNIESSSTLHEMDFNKLKTYPNPAKDYIEVKNLNTQNEFNYSILSLDGKLIAVGKCFEGKKINISLIPDGFYLFRLESLNQSVIKKILISK